MKKKPVFQSILYFCVSLVEKNVRNVKNVRFKIKTRPDKRTGLKIFNEPLLACLRYSEVSAMKIHPFKAHQRLESNRDISKNRNTPILLHIFRFIIRSKKKKPYSLHNWYLLHFQRYDIVLNEPTSYVIPAHWTSYRNLFRSLERKKRENERFCENGNHGNR